MPPRRPWNLRPGGSGRLWAKAGLALAVIAVLYTVGATGAHH